MSAQQQPEEHAPDEPTSAPPAGAAEGPPTPAVSQWGGPPPGQQTSEWAGLGETSEWGGPPPGATAPGERETDLDLDSEPPNMSPIRGGGRRGGWLRGLGLGTLVFVVMLLFVLALAFAAFFNTGVSAIDVARVGGLLFFSFHHVGINAEFPSFDPSGLLGAGEGPDVGLGPIDISFTVSVALLLATFLALSLLYRSGRRAANEGGGSVPHRMLQGAVVGIPYALLAVLLSLVAGYEFDVPAELGEILGAAGQVSFSVTPLSALVWPLALGVLAGALGGLASARGALSASASRFRAVLSGAGRGVLVTLVLGFVGLLVLAGLFPEVTAAYFRAATDGRSGLILLGVTVLSVPNMAVLGAKLGMGSSIVMGEYLGGASEHVASLLRFPRELDPEVLAGGVAPVAPGASPVDFGLAPAGYLLFILVPLVATIFAGRRAARRGGAASRGEGALLGLLAGVLWGLAMVLLGVLSGIGFGASMGIGGVAQAQAGHLGPDLLLGGALALGWGAVGGVIGGTTGALGAARSARQPGSTPDQAPEPAFGPTGFEGLAAERHAFGEANIQQGPDEGQDGLFPEEDHADASSAFEFVTPETQYRGPHGTEQRPEAEEVPPPAEPAPDQPPSVPPPAPPVPEPAQAQGALEEDRPVPPPWASPESSDQPVPPPWEQPEAEASDEEEPPEPGQGGAEPPPWAVPDQEDRADPAPGQGGAEPPPWAVPDQEDRADPAPATPWGGPPGRDAHPSGQPPPPWAAPPGEEERPEWWPKDAPAKGPAEPEAPGHDEEGGPPPERPSGED